MKVFITDDSELVVDRLVSMLSGIDNVEIVGQAKDAQDAIESILKLQPDLVILDIRLRWGNAMDVVDVIKKKQPSSRIIILTSYPYPIYRKKFLEAGADYFLDKSTEFEKIPQIFEQVVAQRTASAMANGCTN